MTRELPLSPPPAVVGRGDARYADLVGRGINARFRPDPDTIRVVTTAEQALRAVADGAREGDRLAVRSGGHCFESLVDDPAVTTVIDVSEMRSVFFDRELQAVSVESGATLGTMYRTLYLAWGVTVPAGRCPEVGVGGHVAGGGGGALSRRFGLSVDHLYGVEAVVVDADGRARLVRATREPDDPHRDLWWAHTGGGGGSFGLVTRYLFRSPDADARPGAADPGALLPVPPAAVLRKTARWDWADIDETAFRTLVRNFGTWHEEHAEPGNPGAGLDNSLALPRTGGGHITLETAVDTTRPDADELTDAFIAAVSRRVGVVPEVSETTLPWLAATLVPDEFAGVKGRFKSKAAFLRTGWTDRQAGLVHRRLTDTSSYGNPAATVYLLSHGAQVNGPDPADTATAHRDAVLKTYWSVFWFDGREDALHLDWIRASYREFFDDAGGVPDPGRGYGGAFVNYADADLADPALNDSGVPWHRLYFRDNYPALRRAKERWDPRDTFRHALSVRVPGADDAAD
ncbi:MULTISPECIES: FAD-binding protein [unclassified Streptomyces]|uniref:FAD-binding protein n=1 Tax=unclassified Streptomyces TaxID=2593676 RepID=UPI00081EDF32|nr:FAD-binding protein [Streptomyces sp. ScaeMP-e83]SCE07199.1 aclacinomycin oxidase [Streptomyces sp. ScaeMP-e83]